MAVGEVAIQPLRQVGHGPALVEPEVLRWFLRSPLFVPELGGRSPKLPPRRSLSQKILDALRRGDVAGARRRPVAPIGAKSFYRLGFRSFWTLAEGEPIRRGSVAEAPPVLPRVGLAPSSGVDLA